MQKAIHVYYQVLWAADTAGREKMQWGEKKMEQTNVRTQWGKSVRLG